MKMNNFEYTIGNLKISRSTLIFNMGPAATCPSLKLGLCKHPKDCYAYNAERQYPNVRNFRARQEIYWTNSTVAENIQDFKQALAKHKKVKYVRFNESGDFHDQGDVIALSTIAKQLPHIIFYGYTSRPDLFLGMLPDNLVIQGTEFMVDNAFWAYPRHTKNIIEWAESKGIDKNTIAFCPGSCHFCFRCKEKKGYNILIEAH